MIKHLLILFICLHSYIEIKAQSYGNEWISYSQKYFKIKIAKNGVYRLDSATLASAGVSLNSLNPRNFQIFNKGVEQFIFINGENDGVFNSTDFIEFYAQKNDGQLDSLLYFNTSFIPNPYYSLINDTATYYLTWNSSINNKRMKLESDVLFGSYLPSNYFMKEEIQSYNNGYYEGETNNAGGTDCRYVASEGYFDANILTLGSSLNYTLNTSNIYNSSFAPNAAITTVLVGASKDNGLLSLSTPDHHLRISYKKSTAASYSALSDTVFKGYTANKFAYSLSPNLLGSISTNFNFVSMLDAGFVSNRTAISYITIKYPHTFDLEAQNSFVMYLPDNTTQLKSFLNISNFVALGNVRLYDLSNGKRIDVIKNASNFNALVPNSGKEKKCFITSDGYITKITSVQPVTASGQFTNYSTLATDSAFVIVTNKLLLSSANDYKHYRSTNIYGGLHNVVFADIDELYDQFAYGIVKSPLSVRGFCNYLLNTYPTKPQNLFLIGKSLHMRLCRQNAANYANCLVPSFGNASSDNLFTSGLNGTQLEPAIPTGRLAAKSDADVTAYLNKIIQYEDQLNNPPAEWKKKVLHFGGGKFNYEQQEFKNYLTNYKDTIQNKYYGAQVTEFFKTNPEPIQINTSANLRNLINNGVSLMTFFGHGSATTGFDQSIDNVNSYNPIPGHYPFLLANGCFVGNIHDTEISDSENYLLTPDKGMIGYLGTAGLGIPYTLNIYSQEFYNQLARKNYNKSIGSTIQKTVSTIQSGAAADPLVASVCYEMNLHGDPSLKLNMYNQPDYVITNDKVFFDLTSDVDSVTVYIVRTNIGKQLKDSIVTEMIRTFPNGQTELYHASSLAPAFKDTIFFKVYIDQSRGIGMNQLKITLDAYNEVVELNENNNTTTQIDMLIEGTGILPVYPSEFAIIAKDTVTLRASTIDPFAAKKNYVLQFDTIDTFNSPFLLTTKINAPGGVVSFKPAVTFTDSTVYYWRVSADSINTKGYQWKESSFQYIKNKTGWGQAHFFQFKNDDYQYVKFNRPQRRFDFANDIKTIQVHDAIYFSAPDYYLIKWTINNFQKTYWHCNGVNPSFSIAVINPVTGENLKSPIIPNPASNANNGVYNECHCRDYVQESFEYLVTDSVKRNFLINFLNNDVPNGWYVLAYSMNQLNYAGFEPAFFTAFENMGSSQIRNIPQSRPYVFFGKKGSPIGSANEVIGSSLNSVIDFSTTFPTNFDKGTISSPIIGPAKKWRTFHWRQHVADSPFVINWDSVEVKLIGIQPNGTETTLTIFPKDSIDIFDLSTYADASVYPRIRLEASMKDHVLHTPPQMERWQVIYDEIPEGAINPPLGYYISNDTVQEGSSINIHIPFQNISNTAFADSLLFTYWNKDVNGLSSPLFSHVKKNLLMPNELLIDTVKLNTSKYIGINSLWVEVNPINQSKSQLEQFHFNNSTKIPFVISSDHINPLLDVTYDGIHILNRDIVSPKPNILIKLKDENKFLALNDTNDFNVFIQTPASGVAKKVYFGSEMLFIPAVLPNNSCQLHYTPTFTQDGTHQLIVQAKDKSSNQSGAVDYKMSFEVINKSSITEVMNFPNPFSTSTKFVFTITGTQLPTYFKIQILNISGKVVSEITQDELGPLHIGRNITEYAWNGKDEFGDQLANGVYLYRVVTSINGAAIEKMETGADSFFKKGFGKMYLMR